MANSLAGRWVRAAAKADSAELTLTSAEKKWKSSARTLSSYTPARSGPSSASELTLTSFSASRSPASDTSQTCKMGEVDAKELFTGQNPLCQTKKEMLSCF